MTTFFRLARPALLGVATAILLSHVTSARLSAQTASVTAKEAWVREAPAGRTVTAVFLILQNAGSAERSVVSGKAEVADTLELHEMKRDGGMMRMSPVKAIAVPAGGQVELRPGGLHLMLFGLKKPLLLGDTVRVTLTLDDATQLLLKAPVRQMGMTP